MLSSSLRNHARRMISHGGFPSRLETTLNHHHHHHRISANLPPPLNIFNPLRFSSTSRTSISSAYTRALLNHQQKPESPPLKSEKIPENIPKISILPSLSCINQPMKETLVSTNLDSKENSESSDQEDKTSSQRGRLLVEILKNVLKKINWKRVCIIIGVLSVLGLLGYIAIQIIMFWLVMYLLAVLFVAIPQAFFLALSSRKEKEKDDTV